MSRNAVLVLSATFLMMLTGLAACVSPAELRAHDEAACTSYGFQPRTPDFAACLQREGLAGGDLYGPALHGRSYGPGWYPRPPRVIK
jgi:hypothetical protein